MYTNELLYTYQLLRKPAFRPPSLYTNHLLHQPTFTNHLLHKSAFTQTSFYANQLLDNHLLRKPAFTSTSFYDPAATRTTFSTN